MSSELEKSFQNLSDVESFADTQSVSVRFNPFTLRSLNIQLINEQSGEVIANGTGFFYRFEGTYWLITNHHNFSGVDISSKKRLDSSGASPTGVIVPLLIESRGRLTWEHAIFPLYTSEKPNWFVHPKDGSSIDVVAIPLDLIDKEEFIESINDEGIIDDTLNIEVADDVFVVGYPENITRFKNIPIWKRASVASEPELNLDDLPKMFIDTASRRGMSGSPVLYRKSLMNGLHSYKLVGIYSGRITTAGDLDTQIGIVWKTIVIEEIIKGKVKDNLYYPGESFAGQ